MLQNFESLGIDDRILDAIKSMEWDEPSPVQIATIPLILEGKDVIGQAQTGTGKTAAFGIPLLQSIEPGKKPSALILCPTRELAVQVSDEMKRLGEYVSLRIISVYGGAGIEPQISAMKDGVDIVVGTPGRIIDHIHRNTIDLNNIKYMVLDEADRMLDMGFIEDIRYVLSKLPKSHQTLLFSATMPTEIKNLSEKYMKDPEIVSVSEDILVLPNTEQMYIPIGRRNKIWALCRILEANKPKTIVFAQTKFIVDMIDKRLKSYGYPVAAIHGDLSQSKREKVLKDFRSGKTNVLIATDVAARGLDIEGVTMVVNYDIPDSPETYVHRIGRTGRAGKEGRAITFVSSNETHLLEAIEAFTESKIPKFEVPTQNGKTKVKEVIDFDEIADIFGMVKIEISSGNESGTTSNEILELFIKKARISEMMIGAITIGSKTSVIEVHKSVAMKAMHALNQTNFKGKRLGARPYQS